MANHQPTREELRHQAQNLIDRFNFEAVHDHMKKTKWTWCRGGKCSVPTKDDLVDQAWRLLQSVIESDDLVTNCCTGGFAAYKLPWGLELSFQLEHKIGA